MAAKQICKFNNNLLSSLGDEAVDERIEGYDLSIVCTFDAFL
jgi:hypothetical protein